MTNENSIGGTALVNSATTGLKHSLRSATRAKEEQLEEATLIREEEKVMDEDDEEVTSEEDSETADAAEKMERTMLTVALVNSVVDARKLSDDTGDPTDPSKHRYGLRKRRRQSGEDLKRLEHFQSTTEGGLARVAKRPEPSGEPDHDGVAGGKLAPLPLPPVLDDQKVKIKLKDPNLITKLDDPCLEAEPDPPVPPTLPTVTPKPEPDQTKVTAIPDQPKVTAKPDQPTATRKESDASRDSLPQSSSVSTSSVPNPLNRPIHPPSTLLPNAKSPKPAVSSNIPTATILPPDVPCPLPAAAFKENVDPPEDKEIYVAPESGDKRKVTINESVRSRGFSIDMDGKSLLPSSRILYVVEDLSSH
jgi:hypothetical protein